MSGEVGGEGATAASPVCSMCLFPLADWSCVYCCSYAEHLLKHAQMY